MTETTGSGRDEQPAAADDTTAGGSTGTGEQPAGEATAGPGFAGAGAAGERPRPAPPLFVRPREGRMVAGVCAGIAARWGFDVALVRVAAVVAALLTGVGVAAYVVAWLLTPSVDAPAPLEPGSSLSGSLARGRSRVGGRRGLRLVAIVVAAVLLVGIVRSLFWWDWHGGWGAPFGLCVALLAVALVVGTRGGRWLLAALVALLVLAAGSVAAFGSHFGTRTYHVASVDDLRSHYDYGAGRVELDLSALTASGRHRTEVRVGRGDVDVTLPAGAQAVVHGRSGWGSVTVAGHEVSGIDAEQTQSIGAGVDTSDDRLTVDVVVGVGDVDVHIGS